MNDLLIDEKSVDIEAHYTRYRQAPLAHAAANGHRGFVQLLVEKGVNIEGSRRICMAGRLYCGHAGNGHEAVVQLLLDNGANIEAKSNALMAGRHCRGPLRMGTRLAVQLLLDNGANIEAKE